MTKPGPRPIPTASLKLHGGYRPHRHDRRMDAQPALGKPTKPELDEVGGALWDQIIEQHQNLGTLGAIDTAALTSLCETWSLYRRAHERAKSDPCDKDARCSTLAYLSMANR